MTKQTKDVQTVIDELATKGVEALDAMANFTQEQVDHIVHQAAIAALDKHMYLAKLAVDETGRGIYEDKAIKNMYASEYIWNSIKYDKTVGVIAEDKEQGLISIAEPVGVICGVTPTTNPTSTTIFKALIALKTRNSIIFAFHPSAQKSSAEAARIVRDAAIEAGAPKDCIQWIEEPSIEATGLLMNHPKIATVLATGGPGMVKAAYSTGKPALGVGAGNVPSYIAADAKVKRAVNDIIVSKTFDNGMICASEQAAIVDAAIYDEVKAEFEAHQCVIISKKADIAKLEKVVLNEARIAVNGAIVEVTQLSKLLKKLVLKFLQVQNCFWQKFQMQQWNTHLPWKNCLQYLLLSNLTALKMVSKKQKVCSIWVVLDTQLLSTLKMKSSNSNTVSV